MKNDQVEVRAVIFCFCGDSLLTHVQRVRIHSLSVVAFPPILLSQKLLWLGKPRRVWSLCVSESVSQRS